jgi:hypothetical protein
LYGVLPDGSEKPWRAAYHQLVISEVEGNAASLAFGVSPGHGVVYSYIL